MRFTSRPLSVSGPAIPLFLGQPALEPVRLSGQEGMNSLFEHELLLKTPDTLDFGVCEAAVGAIGAGKVVLSMQGQFQVKSGGTAFEGSGTLVTELRSFPLTAFNDSFVLKSSSGERLAQMKYRLTHKDGSVFEGVTGVDGAIPLAKSLSPEDVALELLGFQN